MEKEVKPNLVRILDISLTAVFGLEFLVQLMGYGLLGNKGYLKRAWLNPVNFLVLIFAVLALVVPYPYSVLFEKLKVLRFIYIIYDSYIHNS